MKWHDASPQEKTERVMRHVDFWVVLLGTLFVSAVLVVGFYWWVIRPIVHALHR